MWTDFNTNKTNLIICSIAWNHTLANVVLKLSILRRLLCNLLLKLFSPLLFPFLCLCEVQLNTSLWPARSFTQDHYWWTRSEWLSERERVHEGYRIFIYYPSHILMQPLCSKKGLLIYSFYGEFAKKMTLQEGWSEWLKFFELALQSCIQFCIKYTEMHSKSRPSSSL